MVMSFQQSVELQQFYDDLKTLRKGDTTRRENKNLDKMIDVLEPWVRKAEDITIQHSDGEFRK